MSKLFKHNDYDQYKKWLYLTVYDLNVKPALQTQGNNYKFCLSDNTESRIVDRGLSWSIGTTSNNIGKEVLPLLCLLTNNWSLGRATVVGDTSLNTNND